MATPLLEKAKIIFGEHYSDKVVSIRRLSGDVNATFFIESGHRKIILQRLSKIFDSKLIDDFQVISSHLHSNGWEVPALITTKHHNNYARDNENYLWRALTYIESTGTPKNLDLISLGQIIAKFNNTLAELDYLPLYKVPHYRDTPYFANKLESLCKELKPAPSLVATQVIADYAELPKLPAIKQQLIHADARAGNILFHGSKAFTLIDYDTVMMGTIWIELGDAVRSLVEQDLLYGSTTSKQNLKKFTDAYIAESTYDYEKDYFYQTVMLAASYISLELTMRFLNDTVEDYYFAWENTPYKSRYDYLMFRIDQQQEIYQRIRRLK